MHLPISIAQMTSRKVYDGHQRPRDTENFLYSGNPPPSTSSSLIVRRICMAVGGEEDWGPFCISQRGGFAEQSIILQRHVEGMVPIIKEEERTESNTIEGKRVGRVDLRLIGKCSLHLSSTLRVVGMESGGILRAMVAGRSRDC
ncbi:hypothetical protein CEXT_204661 [Caerostris extrusa]|uniref:Uncharacterized protein n=1 Tax=Caerostris extrusa TaxID=172846 RepID=A0AAV4MQR6_CAEEX|nr:hypothetical protein CEXT_204661 [Caerostris extrusa]